MHYLPFLGSGHPRLPTPCWSGRAPLCPNGSQHLYKPLVVMDTPSGARITVNGKPDVINLSSNNYLGLANHPKLKAAAIQAIEEWGAGAGAVRPIIGTMRIHMELEQRLAAFKHVEATLVFQSGFTANAGVIPTITDGDDAHGSGVLGGGRGTAYHFGVHDRIDVQLGTLSKAVGVMGGYIAGSARLIDWLVQRARPFLFSTAQPPAAVAAIMAAIELMDTDPSFTERLWDNARYWKDGLQKLGFDTGISQTPITPVMVGDEGKAQQLQRGLFEEGVLALAIVFPTVARGKARIRPCPAPCTSAKTSTMPWLPLRRSANSSVSSEHARIDAALLHSATFGIFVAAIMPTQDSHRRCEKSAGEVVFAAYPVTLIEFARQRPGCLHGLLPGGGAHYHQVR
jgi:7-keto-8-aminopelargonate synthetase-like enzyme